MRFTRSAAVLLAVVLCASPVSAELRLPTTKDSFEARARVFAAPVAPRPAFSAQPRHKTARGVAGAALGGLGGFYAGALIGYQLDSLGNCHCDDPGLMGVVIGAPIGAALGGLLGWVLATR